VLETARHRFFMLMLLFSGVFFTLGYVRRNETMAVRAH